LTPPAQAELAGDAPWPRIAERTLAEHGRRDGPFVLGLCGPQGSGKSTGADALQRLLEDRGARTAVFSLDDLYLTKAERAGLAASVHPLFATRGPPGTHDIALGLATLDALARRGGVRLPRFDKATDDRAPTSAWPEIETPVDLVIFEGWCVGARPQPVEALDLPINALEAAEDPDGRWRAAVNQALAGAYQTLFSRIDLLVLLRPPAFDVVLDWRREQEQGLRARTGGGMSDAALVRFIQHYERLTRWIDAEAPARAEVVIPLDAGRRPVAVIGL
jgi:D-glycerate 3-kinase